MDQIQTCPPLELVIEQMEAQYQERPAFQADLPDGSKLVFFVSDDGKSWTVVRTNGAVACPAGSGENFRALTIEKGRKT